MIRTTYAERIVDVIDYFPDVNLWMARLACRLQRTLAIPGRMRAARAAGLLDGGPPAGRVARFSRPAPTSPPGRWLPHWPPHRAPARCGPREMPDDSGYVHRAIVAVAMAVGGPIVIDPIIAGYWIQHGGMLSSRRIAIRPRSPGSSPGISRASTGSWTGPRSLATNGTRSSVTGRHGYPSTWSGAGSRISRNWPPEGRADAGSIESSKSYPNPMIPPLHL